MSFASAYISRRMGVNVRITRSGPETCWVVIWSKDTSGGRWGGTYIHIAFDISNEDEVAGAGVADIGVDGDGPSRVPLNRVGQGLGITVDKSAGLVGETEGGGAKHFASREREMSRTVF